MFSEADLLPISALQHFIFCQRQAALIHIERLWVENRHTAAGRVLHERAHSGNDQVRDGVRTARSLPVMSRRLGLFGVCDVVELEPPAAPHTRVTPIEYKRGRPKSHDADRVQLAAQALCLEEMLATPVTTGQIFYGKTRRRADVAIDTTLRRRTEQTATDLRRLIDAGVTPPARREPKCDRCSLLELCMPDTLKPRRSVHTRFTHLLRQSLSSPGADPHNREPSP